MQFERDTNGVLHPLPKPSVDTGMGLERLAAVMQRVHSNYDTDVLRTLVREAAAAVGTAVSDEPSLRVIADHIRACSFLIVDGVLPSNEGRGYVLRRIIRRAVRHGHKLGQTAPFFHRLVAPLDRLMGDAYPELRVAHARVEQALLGEELRFAETLSQGMAILDSVIGELRGTEIPGETVFKLYDTYGFPVDLTADIARERGLTLDETGFERAMDAQRERGRAASQFAGDYARIELDDPTDFTGYEQHVGDAHIVALFRDGTRVDALAEGEHGMVALDRSPFYAESGGPVGDTGALGNADGDFEVADTRKHGRHAQLHVGRVTRGTLRAGDAVATRIDAERRHAIMLKQSATHLLHAALREQLGTHVQQKGSLVAPDRLRFDFSHPQPVSADELAAIERRVNAEIRRNADADVREMSMDEAMTAGAIALFGEKYGERVRVLKFGDFSTELCGGTHVRRTGDIGLFKIVSETGISSGVRRIEAVTGAGALDWVAQQEVLLDRVGALLKTGRDGLEDRIAQALDRSKRLEKELDQLRAKLASGQGGADLAAQATTVSDTRVLAARVDGLDGKALRDAVDRLKDKLKTAAIVLAAVNDGRVVLAAGVTADRTAVLSAGDLVRHVAEQVGGKGGGRADFAQAGGTDPTHLDAALASVAGWVQERL